ncbi:MAG: Membrane alanine aminopeptidase, partial [Labilithrix sp.]|nr:Membrane alanine aminopeptidase [Labilithrix sp.]
MRRPSSRPSIAFWSSALVSLLLAGCPGEPPPAPPHPAPAVTDAPTTLPEPLPSGRLPALATPVGYAIDFDVDPEKPRFSGVARIEIDIPAKTSFVVLHGRSLDVNSARVLLPPPQPGVLATVSSRTAQGGKAPEELVLA